MSNANQDNSASTPGAGHAASESLDPAAARERGDFDHLIQKAQELVRNLDSLSASASPPAEPQPLDSEPTTIAELDRALAANLDAALQDHDAIVQEVLEGVFEEQATIVQNIEDPPVVEAPVEIAPRPATAPPAPTQALGPAKPNPLVDVAAVAVAPPVPPQPPPLPIPSAAEPIAERPVASQAPMPEPAMAQKPPQDYVNEPPVTPISTGAGATIGPVQPNSVARQAPAELPALVVESKPRISPMKLAAKLARLLVPVLVMVNYPLRLIPGSMRTAVDWVALSLLVWVPIVWIMVIAFGHGGASRTPHGSHESSAAIHDSSTNFTESKHQQAKPSRDAHEPDGSSAHH
jgi:hypothetical protein